VPIHDEKAQLVVEDLRHPLPLVNVTLRPVDDRNEAEPQWIHFAFDNIAAVRPRVHDVELREGGSTSRAMSSESEFADNITRMIEFSGLICSITIARIYVGRSSDCLSVGTFVRPGRSTRVRFSTFGEEL
jgi:hypothetical protein